MIKFTEYNKLFLKKSWEWLKNDELRHLIDSPQISKNDQLNWFNNLKNKKNYLIWGILFGNKPIGACGLKNITDEEGEYWGYIAEKEYWGKGYGKTIIDYIEKVAKKMKLKRIYLKVIKDNLRAIGLYKKTGFILETEQNNLIIMYKNV